MARKNNNEQRYSCPRDQHLSIPCGPVDGPLNSIGPSQHYRTEGFKASHRATPVSRTLDGKFPSVAEGGENKKRPSMILRYRYVVARNEFCSYGYIVEARAIT